MSRLYGEQHRALQDEFDRRRMADRIETIALKTELGDAERAFVESRSMFFLTTVDHRGRPTVSYKGGPRRFRISLLISCSGTPCSTRPSKS